MASLSLGWEKPFWAGIAVVVCCLATRGDVLNRGLLRVVGTLGGAVVTVVLMALFAQDRWAFMVAMSLFIALCTYMMQTTTRWYAWFVAGFTVPILALSSGPTVLNTFEEIILRAQETTLGVVVYGVVAVLLWPKSSQPSFATAMSGVVRDERTLLTASARLLTASPVDEEEKRARSRVQQTLSGLDPQLDAAELDSYEVWELRHTWRLCIRQLAALAAGLERWHQGLKAPAGHEQAFSAEDVSAFAAELDHRLALIERMLAGGPAERRPPRFEPRLDRQRLGSLPHLGRAAAVLTFDQMVRLERDTDALFVTVANIRRGRPARVAGAVPGPGPMLDLDRLVAVARHLTVLWLLLLLFVYVPNLPAPVALIGLGNVLSMLTTFKPELRAKIFPPVFFGSLIGAGIYMFLMPKLSGFASLGLILFSVSFAIYYIKPLPSQVIDRIFLLLMPVLFTQITSEQSYSVVTVAELALAMAMIFALLALAARFPVSMRPEDVIIRLVKRFFRSCEVLMAAGRLAPTHTPSRLVSWRIAFHAHEVATIPQKLALWCEALPPRTVVDAAPDQLRPFVLGLQVLGDRMAELLEARKEPQSEAVARVPFAYVRAWRSEVQHVFGRLALEPEAADRPTVRSKLGAMLERLEGRVEEALDKAEDGRLSARDSEAMYRLLGAHRGVSDALFDVVRRAGPVDWSRLREVRF